MALVINTNVSALQASRYLTFNSRQLNNTLEKLSSGYKINRAADDAAGLSISEGIRTQTRGLYQAYNNAQDGANLLEVAEGGLSVITENLQRMRELTVQAGNDTNATNERRAIALEVAARINDITRIARTLKFNSIELLTGNSSQAMLQIGANSAPSTNVLTVGSVLRCCTAGTSGFNLTAGGNITVAAGGRFNSGTTARAFLGTIDTALQTVFSRRSQIGAYQNRLQSTIQSISIQRENLSSCDSRIRDTDVAEESAKMTKWQILQQSSMSVLAQANQTPALALKLLG